MRTRAYRRNQMFRVQRKRFKAIKHRFSDWLRDGEQYRYASVWKADLRPIDAGFFEQLRWSHFGCGCPMCKPWKHFKRDAFKISERRRLQVDGEYAG